MPDMTANFSLPYPAPSDDPCLFAEQWCDFTDAIDAVIANFTLGADRAVPLIPAAMLRATITRAILPGNPIPFDEVVFDTAGMTDLDADPYHIFIRQPGRYTTAAFFSKVSSGAVNSVTTLQMENIQGHILDRGAGPAYYLPLYSPSQNFLTVGTEVSIEYFSGSNSPQDIDSAWMSVFWHADTEVM
jgi:hypothetical protein